MDYTKVLKSKDINTITILNCNNKTNEIQDQMSLNCEQYPKRDEIRQTLLYFSIKVIFVILRQRCSSQMQIARVVIHCICADRRCFV